MRYSALLVVALPFVATAQQAAPREFSVEASHSRVGFAIPFLATQVRGTFDDIKGTISYDPSAVERSSVSIAIDTKSIHTGSQHRDTHLRSDDFFDVTNHPRMTFRSDRIARSENGFVLHGPLTIRGVTRLVSIVFRQVRPILEEPQGLDVVNFEGTLKLARKDFGILGGSKQNAWFDEVRSATMGDTVQITLDIQAWETAFARHTKYDATLAKFAREGLGPTIERLRKLKAEKQSLDGADWEAEQLARTLLARGRKEEALKLVELGLELVPESVRMQTAAARVYELVGDHDRARAATVRAAAVAPDEPRVIELQRRLRKLR